MSTTPPQSPLQMPVQSLDTWSGASIRLSGDAATRNARIFVFGLTGVLTGAGTYGMYQVISPVNVTWLQLLFAFVFALTFTWISFACASAILGFWVLVTKQQELPALAPHARMGRTALLMPVYNEDPGSVFKALERMGRSIIWQGAQRHFDIFVVSDTRNASTAKQEEDCFQALRREFLGQMGVYYRRRADNHHRKAGNVADFVTPLGRRL